jgi:hypothetical protein
MHDVGLTELIVLVRPVHQLLHALSQPMQHMVQRITIANLGPPSTRSIAAHVQYLQEAPNRLRQLVRVLIR